MSVLLSIKPKYINKIKKGSKRYEFRRTIFKQEVTEIYVYATSPIKKIVGKIIIEDIIQDVPEQLWKSYYRKAGICSTSATSAAHAASSAVWMSVTMGTCNSSFTAFRIAKAFSSPMPVKELADERLAFL